MARSTKDMTEDINVNDLPDDYPTDEENTLLTHDPGEVGAGTGWILVLGSFVLAVLSIVIYRWTEES